MTSSMTQCRVASIRETQYRVVVRKEAELEQSSGDL
jgi:hypothetical protein